MKISMFEKEIIVYQKKNRDHKIQIQNLFAKQQTLVDDALSQQSMSMSSKYFNDTDISDIEKMEEKIKKLEKQIEETNAEHQKGITYNFELTSELSQLENKHKKQKSQYQMSIDNF